MGGAGVLVGWNVMRSRVGVAEVVSCESTRTVGSGRSVCLELRSGSGVEQAKTVSAMMAANPAVRRFMMYSSCLLKAGARLVAMRFYHRRPGRGALERAAAGGRRG